MPGLTKTNLYSFASFFFEVFALGIRRVEGRFAFGKHLLTWCHILQAYKKTSIKAPRFHIKTTLALGYIAWKLARTMHGLESRYHEWDFMGYTSKLAEYHLKRLKRYIRNLPEYFGEFRDLTESDIILHYGHNGNEFECWPWGITGFNRGRHPNGMVLDDILRDPTVKLDLTVLEELSRTFKEEIMPMPKEELHLFGTAQDEEDLFKEVSEMPEFYAREFEAAMDFDKKIALWPEVYPFERLISIRENIGEKAFNKEYQGRPARGEDNFFKPDEYDALTYERLKNYELTGHIKLKEFAYGGFDIGKKSHPSHLCVFGVRKGKLIQVLDKWLDRWNYTDQLDYLKQAIQFFNIQSLYYDNTRSEFEGFYEQGQLPAAMTGIEMTRKMQFAAATELDALCSKKQIMLIKDKRTRRQMLKVDNDLKSLADKEGHGDCFKSLLLAVAAFKQGEPKVWVF